MISANTEQVSFNFEVINETSSSKVKSCTKENQSKPNFDKIDVISRVHFSIEEEKEDLDESNEDSVDVYVDDNMTECDLYDFHNDLGDFGDLGVEVDERVFCAICFIFIIVVIVVYIFYYCIK